MHLQFVSALLTRMGAALTEIAQASMAARILEKAFIFAPVF
jgi:hypothetical protein